MVLVSVETTGMRGSAGRGHVNNTINHCFYNGSVVAHLDVPPQIPPERPRCWFKAAPASATNTDEGLLQPTYTEADHGFSTQIEVYPRTTWAFRNLPANTTTAPAAKWGPTLSFPCR
jgi:hypothetical protein